MKHLTRLCVLTLIFSLVLASSAYAHSGRTDAKGGHNCSQKSINKGLCTGYHYHNSGKSSSSEAKSTKSTNSIKSTKSSTSNVNSKTPSSTATKAAKKDEYAVSSVTLSVNDKAVIFSKDVLIKDHANYFPIREVAEAIGATVQFDTDSSTITISKDGKKKTIDTNSQVVISKNSTTYAPIREIVSTLDILIEFSAQANHINLTF